MPETRIIGQIAERGLKVAILTVENMSAANQTVVVRGVRRSFGTPIHERKTKERRRVVEALAVPSPWYTSC
jgi:hypothetical protein